MSKNSTEEAFILSGETYSGIYFIVQFLDKNY